MVEMLEVVTNFKGYSYVNKILPEKRKSFYYFQERVNGWLKSSYRAKASYSSLN